MNDIDTDREIWTWERLMKETDDYVVWIVSEPLYKPGFRMTERAYQDVQKALEWVN